MAEQRMGIPPVGQPLSDYFSASASSRPSLGGRGSINSSQYSASEQGLVGLSPMNSVPYESVWCGQAGYPRVFVADEGSR